MTTGLVRREKSTSFLSEGGNSLVDKVPVGVGNEASLGCAGLRSPLSSKNVCFTFSQNEGWITTVIQPSLSSQPSITSLAIYTLTRVTRIKSEQRLRCSACPQTRAFLSDPKHHP